MAKATCSADDCEQAAVVKGLCGAHYQAARRAAPEYVAHLANRPACSIEGCSKPVKARSLCSQHLYHLRVHGDPHHQPISTEARFRAKVTPLGPDDCWVWQGSLTRDGYGKFAGGRAHRFAWKFAHSQEIPEGLMVRHACDNPPCCNPAHLLLGSGRDNVRDRVDRGRSARGDNVGVRRHPERAAKGMRNAHAKLTDDDVREIRRLYPLGGMSQEQLAQQFGVVQSVISAVIRRERWAHVE